MGWLYTRGETRKELIQRCLSGSASPSGFKAAAHAIVHNHLWVVFEQERAAVVTPPKGSSQPPAERFIALYLMASHRGYGWGYKAMEEGMGPCEVDCPIRFLDLARVPNGTYSSEWRARVTQFHSARAAKRSYIKHLTVGQAVTLAPGCRPSEVVVVSIMPLRGRAEDGLVYRIAPRHVVVPAIH